MVLAAEALDERGRIIWRSRSTAQPHKGSFYRTWQGDALDGKTLRSAMRTGAGAASFSTTAGHPSSAEPAASQGYQVERAYFSLDGKPRSRHVQAERPARRDLESHRDGSRLCAPSACRSFARRPRDRQSRLFDGGSIEALSLAQERCRADPHGISRRSFRRGLRARRRGQGDVLRRLYRPRGDARAVTCCRRRRSRTCTGRSVSAAPAFGRRRYRRRR